MRFSLKRSYYGRVVQLVRMPARHAEGRRFESGHGRQFQLVRRTLTSFSPLTDCFIAADVQRDSTIIDGKTLASGEVGSDRSEETNVIEM